MRKEEIIQEAYRIGFDQVQMLPASEVHYRPEFRKYCEMNYCGNYGNNYSCPPACGTPEEMEARTRDYDTVLVLQTITPVKDILDDDETKPIKLRHNAMTWSLIEEIAGWLGECLPAMAGPCGLCSPCALTLGEDCRFPEKKASCLSAYCIKVDDLAQACGMSYWCEGKVAFFSLLFLKENERS